MNYLMQTALDLSFLKPLSVLSSLNSLNVTVRNVYSEKYPCMRSNVVVRKMR
jgi:hypothetical protein